ncbi:DUF1631 family protein [Silvimonas amylolytica]|uniref:Thymidine phosphorylase n=1 Tax=Silvimonas amylolytica TaxID=449663 RepID=A0ABQ2PGI2_9NEIS|nr:DUF1631 family protein [Silvimonas amylolytica]GGP24376.1 hypothetical protein GCM10010971_01950 [Silvimonas amylolytica]
MNSAQEVRGSPTPNDTLVACRDMALKLLTQSMEGFFTQLEETFFTLAENTHDNKLRDSYFAARYELQSKRTTILTAFRQQFLETFAQRLEGKTNNGTFFKVTQSLGELSLVANDDYEESLTASGVANALKNSGGDTLQQLEQRLARLMPLSEDAAASNPLSPDVICEAVMAACRVFESGIGARLAAMKAFETNLSGQISKVYTDLNQFLIQRNVHPAPLRGGQSRAPSRAPYMGDRQPDAAGGAPQGGFDQGQYQGGYGNQPQYGGYSQPMQNYAVTPELVAHLHQLAAGNMQPQAQSSLRPEWFGFLNNLQRDPPNGGLTANGQPENLLSVLRTTRWVNELNRVDTMTFDLVSMLFDRLFADQRLPNAAKGLLARLQIPVLKVSMLDGSFFARKAHPARQLIDLLEEAFLDYDGEPDDTDPKFAKFSGVVAWIADHFEDEVGVFDTALADIKRFLAEEAAALEQKASAAADDLLQTEVAEIASATATTLVQSRLARAGEVPPLVADFLTQWWAPAMAKSWGPNGEADPVFAQRQKALDDLLWSLQAKRGPEERLQLVNLLPGMLKVLEQGVTDVGMDQTSSRAFFSELVNCHASAIRTGLRQSAMEPVAAPVLPPPSAPQGVGASVTMHAMPQAIETAPAVHIEPAISFAAAVAEAAAPATDDNNSLPKRGEWLSWTTDDGEERRLRLSWVSPLGTRYLFTNRTGENGLTLTRSDLEMHLASGRLQRLQRDGSATERALNQLKEQLVA